jgi:hypothetical protein
MTTHHFSPSLFYNAIGSHESALVIADGDSVVAETVDAQGFDSQGLKRADRPNPMSGPVFVSGAEPGDALLVRIESITMTRPQLQLTLWLNNKIDLQLKCVIAMLSRPIQLANKRYPHEFISNESWAKT